MTKVRLNALHMIARAGGSITARVFAEAMWPHSFAAERCPVGRKPTGILIGGGCTQKAGAFLKAMNRSKLITKKLNDNGIFVYALGKRALEALRGPVAEVHDGIIYRNEGAYSRRLRETKERLSV